MILALDTASETLALAVAPLQVESEPGGCSHPAGGQLADRPAGSQPDDDQPAGGKLTFTSHPATGTNPAAGSHPAATGIFASNTPAPRKANEVLLQRLSALMDEAGATLKDIQAVVVGRGPGSFTGVRIGVATAKGLACGLNVPLYGVGTLDALAWGAWAGGVRGTIGVVADAMRQEVYPARFNLSEEGVQRLDVDTVAKPAEVDWQTDVLVLGDGLKKHAQHFEGFTFAPEEFWNVTGEGLVLAFQAAARANALNNGNPAEVLPVYTRLSDAEENERRRLAVAADLPANGVSNTLAAGGLYLHPLGMNDIDELVELQAQAMGEDAWSHGKLADELGRADRSWWLARQAGRIVGCAGGQVCAGELAIFQVCTAPNARRQGVATRLLDRVAADAAALGATSITLEVRASNTAAQALYQKLGLQDLGARPKYYRNGEDARILRGPLPLATDAPQPAAQTKANAPAKQGAQNLILAIESSCDETAAAVINPNRRIESSVIASQIDFHSRFGGVVPEIASRKHIEAIVPTVESALQQAGASYQNLQAIAVTQGPGLVGALVVGVAFAKGLAFATEKPLIAVNHLEGHLYANRFADQALQPPFVALLVSGGHTMLVHVKDWGSYEVMGSTLDDAVGEAFDKVAKALQLGYPGGPIISRLAKEGDPKAIDFPRAMLHSGNLAFSLSGLKTAVTTYIHKENEAGRAVNLPNVAASFQAAVVDVQVAKARQACKEAGVQTFCVGGGVAANPALRQALTTQLARYGIRTIVPALEDCGDNAAMIASVALDLFNENCIAPLTLDASAHLPLRS